MYSSFAKCQVFPLVIRISSKPRCLKQSDPGNSYSLSIGSHTKPSLRPVCVHFTTVSHRSDYKCHKVFNFVCETNTKCKSMEVGVAARGKSISNGFTLGSAVQCCSMLRARSFYRLYSQGVGEGGHVLGAGESLPWLSSRSAKEIKGKMASAKNSHSSWEQLTKRLDKSTSSPSWKESAKKLNKGTAAKGGRGFSEESGERLNNGAAISNMVGNNGSRNRMVNADKNGKTGYDYNEKDDNVEEEEEGELEVADDHPRWYRIKNRAIAMVNVKGRADKPELQRWNKQESWGRKTWKEVTQSTVPKMVGEGVYGVGPVLASLSAGRREFYALYVQEGLDLSGNNRKKKDKKGFEKVLRMAQNIGLSIKEISKHDLNMVVDNRPHQGLVLDASPLEMVQIKELDPVLPKEDRRSLWVALDEITDPQNLGAIIRSAYFFGASGVVLCAKNSAPLSGVVSKASAGSLELMELRYCKNMMQFLVSSAENGWRVLGASVSSKAVPLHEILPGEPTILVLGSEGTGLRPLVERSCTQLVRIPGNIPMDIIVEEGDNMEAEEAKPEHSNEDFRSFLAVESLNVSVAAGVVIHHLIGNNQKDTCCIEDP